MGGKRRWIAGACCLAVLAGVCLSGNVCFADGDTGVTIQTFGVDLAATVTNLVTKMTAVLTVVLGVCAGFYLIRWGMRVIRSYAK